MIDLIKNYSITARRMKRSVIRELLKLTEKSEIISFAGGLPDPNHFPYEQLKEVTEVVIKERGHTALQYGATEGDKLLRDELVKLALRDNIKITPDNILVTVASQQGLDLVGKVFIDPSDPVIVELPSYLGGLQAFGAYGANMIGVPLDNNGINVDILESTLHKLKSEGDHYKFVYIVPDFQNPAGVTLSAERREKVIALAKEYSVLILEDTPYRELRFEGEESPSLYSLNTENYVISLHTFSKILVPGLRVGWVVANPEIIQKLAVAKQSADLCSPAFSQAIAAEFCRRGYLIPHIEKIKVIYKKKKDMMMKALEEYMPKDEGISWTRPEGGLFLWLTLPKYLNAEDLFPKALEEKVAYIIGSAFHCDGTGQNTIRLNFSFPGEDEIEKGVKRLAKVVKQAIVAK